MPGENIIINETQSGRSICAGLNDTITLKLTDMSRTGRNWALSATSGLTIKDKGTTWFDENGLPTTIPGLGRGIHTWEIRPVDRGEQKIRANIQPSWQEATTGHGMQVNLSIIVV